jgi:hypothetical protein
MLWRTGNVVDNAKQRKIAAVEKAHHESEVGKS